MADNEKYYYIKLKDSYFDQDNIKVLESMKNGHLYSLIIIKLYLKASKTDGQLMMTQRIPYDPSNVDTLASVLGHDVDHVKEAIRLGVQLDLIKIIDGKEIWMTEIQNMIGQSSTEADRIRLYRKKLDAKALPESKDVQMYDKSTPEIEKEIELEIEPKRESRFCKPTVLEVSEYCKERGNNVNPSAFVAFYDSKGWMIGKNKMKDWRGAVRTWEQRDKKPNRVQGNDVSPELQAKGVFRIENGKYFTERGTEFDPFEVTDNGCPF